jgi:hypothetical protein
MQEQAMLFYGHTTLAQHLIVSGAGSASDKPRLVRDPAPYSKVNSPADCPVGVHA